MAFTGTWATTGTYTRIDLITLQVRIGLRRSTTISQASLAAVQKGIDNHWIKKVSVYGFDNDKLCRAQLVLEIDWNEYNSFLSAGKATVAVDQKWIDNTAIEIDEAVNLFNNFVTQNNLKPEWRVTYVSWVDRDDINRQLGFTRSEPIKWVEQNGRSWINSIPEIPELYVGLYMVY